MSEGLADVLTLDIIDGQLVLTVSASRGLLTLAAALTHLAEHHAAERVTP